MTNVNMNKEQFNIGQADPELPKEVKNATRNNGGMIVPDDFFAQFEKKMNAVIDADIMKQQPIIDQKDSKTISLTRWWASIAAAVILVAFIASAFQFNWFSDQSADQQNLIANTELEDELNPAEDVYYTSLSDYEVYDLICGI